MRTIKTRKKVEGIKVIDKPALLSKRMKDSFIRTKERAEETQNSRHDSPTEYASDSVQNTARETVYHLPNPARKAHENINRAKGHFQEVRRQAPKERQRAAEQAQQTAVKTRDKKITELEAKLAARAPATQEMEAMKAAKESLAAENGALTGRNDSLAKENESLKARCETLAKEAEAKAAKHEAKAGVLHWWLMVAVVAGVFALLGGMGLGASARREAAQKAKDVREGGRA